MSEKEIIFERDGFQIKTNSLYKVTGKEDQNAPTGFLKEGISKLPSEGVDNVIQCRYHITDMQSRTGVWDTGLHEDSPCYYNMDPEDVAATVSKLKKHIVERYKKANGKTRDLDHNDDAFWTNYTVSVRDKRVFDTSKVEDLLVLYVAFHSYTITTMDRKGDPK